MKFETLTFDFHLMSIKQRTDFIRRVNFSFQVNPVVVILGPRQCGKSTLARMYVKN